MVVLRRKNTEKTGHKATCANPDAFLPSRFFTFVPLNPLYPALEYCRYRVRASNEHGLHSPFVYELYNSVIRDETPYYVFGLIESIRARMILSDEVIDVRDFGTGGGRTGSKRRLGVSAIARRFVQSRRHGQLLFRLVNRFRPGKVLELGTSIGITTLYLAAPSGNTEVWTLEGCPETARIAQENFDSVQAPNIHPVVGEFSTTLPDVLRQMGTVDFAFLDGNHRYEATLAYFRQLLPFTHEHSVLVFDDIHWSSEMRSAWEVIRQDPAVTISIDLYQFGIVFFRQGQARQHFTLQY